MELCDVTGRDRDRPGLQRVSLGNDDPTGFITGGAPHRMWLQRQRNEPVDEGKDVATDRRLRAFRREFLHGHIALAAVEVVALGDGEEPTCDGGFLGYVKPLEPHVAIPAIL